MEVKFSGAGTIHQKNATIKLKFKQIKMIYFRCNKKILLRVISRHQDFVVVPIKSTRILKAILKVLPGS